MLRFSLRAESAQYGARLVIARDAVWARASSVPTRKISYNRQSFRPHPSSLRPQLPFLHSSLRKASQRVLVRLLSTEQKRNFRQLVTTWAKWTVAFWTFVALIATAKFGIDNEVLERQFPTPHEWSWISRWKLRSALGRYRGGELFSIDWSEVGQNYKQLISRLEDTSGDGAGIIPQLGPEEHILVEGIGKTGYDLSAKPEAWRRGYYQALMGAAHVAEQLDTWVRDKERNVVFPANVVIGPSNSRPKPVPYGSPPAPKERDCEPAFDEPQTFYMKILTTKGFTSRQRIDAALAYAGWLNHKGLAQSARDMFDWAFDIALSTRHISAQSPVNKSTGVVDSNSLGVTSNILLVASSLAMHYAKNEKFEAAIPIFTSVLRVQQNLPQMSFEKKTSAPCSGPLSTIRGLVAQKPYPPAPASGDEPATASFANRCATSGTMLHIGEVLFASDKSTPSHSVSPSQLQLSGLSWTRQAVNMAEVTLKELFQSNASSDTTHSSLVHITHESADDIESRKRCGECLKAGMENWQKMLTRFQQAELKAQRRSQTRLRAQSNDLGKVSTGNWFWGTSSTNDLLDRKSSSNDLGIGKSATGLNNTGVWIEEGRIVQQRAIAIRQLLRQLKLE